MHIFASCQCTDYARVARVTFAVGEAVWCCSIQAAMAPPHHRPRLPSPSPKNAVDYIEGIWICQTVWHPYGLYLYGVTTIQSLALMRLTNIMSW